jgi:hypothetical protein
VKFSAQTALVKLQWFKNLFCSEMTDEEFFNDFMLQVIDEWLARKSGVIYIPFNK